MNFELELTNNTLAIKEVENPFKKRKTESGLLLLSDDVAMSDETGQIEVMQKIIGFGIVTSIGPECKSIRVGDGVYYDRRTPTPLPFNDPVWVFNENNIRGIVRSEKGALEAEIERVENEAKAESFKTGLAMNSRPDLYPVTPSIIV